MLTKRAFVLMLAMLWSPAEVFAQRLIPFSIQTISIKDGDPKLAPLDGYMDSVGNVLVQPMFDIADVFSPYGMARVRVDGKWGFVNADGKLVIAPRFDEVLNFSELGLAFAKLAGLFGVINAKGEWVIVPAWPDVQPMLVVKNQWYAPVKTDAGWRVFNGVSYASKATYADAMPFSPSGLLPVKVGSLWGFVDVRGTEVVKPRYERISWNISNTRKFAAQLDGRWGVADLDGKIVLPFIYKNISWFFGPGDEFIVETPAANDSGESEFAYLAENGTPLVNEKFDAAGDFSADGVAFAKKGSIFYKLTSKAKIAKLGQFEEFDNTPFAGVFRYRKGNDCAMYVDENLKPLPGWEKFVGAVNAKAAELKKTVPIIGMVGCVYVN